MIQCYQCHSYIYISKAQCVIIKIDKKHMQRLFVRTSRFCNKKFINIFLNDNNLITVVDTKYKQSTKLTYIYNSVSKYPHGNLQFLRGLYKIKKKLIKSLHLNFWRAQAGFFLWFFINNYNDLSLLVVWLRPDSTVRQISQNFFW